MRIVFFGTPEFAVPSLEALLEHGHEVAGVVTRPDSARGRHRSTLVPPPVKALALAHGLPLLQPAKPAGAEFLTALAAWRPELGVVVAYGHILRPEVLALPPRGMINVHASLLPELRGAAPINWAIARGDRETGITIMRMEEGLDSGPVLRQAPTPIAEDDTAGTLTPRLAALGARTLVDALARMASGALPEQPQEHARATYAPKITRELTRVDWANTAAAVSRRIRAFDPHPGAWTTLGGQEIKLFGARSGPGSGAPGTVIPGGAALRVAAAGGTVEIAEVQPAGRPRMSAAAWLRGHTLRAGATFA